MNAGAILTTLNYDMRQHIADDYMYSPPLSSDIGCLDAPVFIPAGACKKMEYCNGRYEAPMQQILVRDLLDDYEYTDRTAVSTDCASVQK